MKPAELSPAPNLASLAPWATIFADPDFVFGRWAGGEQRDGSTQFAYFAFSDTAQEFLNAVSAGHWVRAEINWSGETERAQFNRLRDDPDAIARASVEEIAHLLTTLVRGDRFNEGMLASAFEDGVIRRSLDRVKALAGDSI